MEKSLRDESNVMKDRFKMGSEFDVSTSISPWPLKTLMSCPAGALFRSMTCRSPITHLFASLTWERDERALQVESTMECGDLVGL
jgi:hypothetical protein